MKTTTLTWILLLAAGVGASAQGLRAREERRPPPVPPIFALFDTDHDRTISTEELQAAAAILGTLDRNGDGEITLDELRPPPTSRKKDTDRPPPGAPPVPPVIGALDADGDGTISPTELEGAPESLKALDKDNDGSLSPRELRPHGPPNGGGGEHPQGPPPAAE